VAADFADRAQGFARVGDCVVVGEHPLQDGVSQGGAADQVVPALDGELAGQHRGAAARAVLQDFEEVAPFGVAQGVRPHSSMASTSMRASSNQNPQKVGLGYPTYPKRRRTLLTLQPAGLK
jgi:hypothetical protein